MLFHRTWRSVGRCSGGFSTGVATVRNSGSNRIPSTVSLKSEAVRNTIQQLEQESALMSTVAGKKILTRAEALYELEPDSNAITKPKE